MFVPRYLSNSLLSDAVAFEDGGVAFEFKNLCRLDLTSASSFSRRLFIIDSRN